MISKELLSEVLGYRVANFSHNGLTNGEIGKNFMLHINPKQREDRPSSCVIAKESINIYELAHKCKEWAHKKEYYVNSGQMDRHSGKNSNKWFATIFNPYGKIGEERSGSLYGREMTRTIFADTEVEAILKACEWVLKDIK